MTQRNENIEKDAFNAASIAQTRGATAKECLEIGIHHAVQSMIDTWQNEIRCTKEVLEKEWHDKRELLQQQYAVIQRENEYLHQLISDAKMFAFIP